MNPILKNILAVITGLVLGSVANMGLVMIGGEVIPPPGGIDSTNMESLAEAMHLFGPEHFIFPFLAHAIGTLVGAYIAARIAATHKMTFAIAIGAFYLLGGIVNAFLLPAPIWFIALDLIGAYLPMALLGGNLAGGRFGNKAALNVNKGAVD